jgi:S1-C subfamily serine protease
MSIDMQELSTSLSATVKAASAAVVRVEARRRAPASGLIWTDGVVVTAEHVIEDEEGARVFLPGGEERAVTSVLRDEATDLALLKVEVSAAPGAVFGDGPDLAVGNLVLAVGRPGRTARASLGVVSALGQSWRTQSGGLIDRYLESDVTPRPGFSGSALVDARGAIVGMNTAGLARGASLAVPTPTLKRVVAELLDKGRVQRGYLGVSTFPVRLPKVMAERAGQDAALLVVGVQADSPADRAGVLLGDAIVSLHGHPVRGMSELVNALGEEQVGQDSRLGILRAGEPRELSVHVGSRAA